MKQPAPFTVVYLRRGVPPPGEEGLLKRAAERSGAAYQSAEGGNGDDARPLSGWDEDERVVIVGSPEHLPRIASSRPSAAFVPLLDPGGESDDGGAPEEQVAMILRRPLRPEDVEEAVRRGGLHASLLAELHELRARVEDQGRELKELNKIGTALSAERSLDTLLNLILTKCREIASADAGSLYLVAKNPGAAPAEADYFADKILIFKLAQNDSVSVPFKEARMEISRRSLAGYVAQTGEMLNIQDAYEIPEDEEYHFNRAFDEASGYRTKSLLIVPMKNQKGEITGVLQLINRKRERETRLDSPQTVEEQVIPFNRRAAELASSLSSQAAVAIENAALYEEIQALFEGFIRASVTAIESRDPTTSGHSERVAILTVGLAQAVDQEDSGPYKSVRFSRTDIKEIKYASLLHDFGKIGVKENVLLKSKKLYEHELQAVKDRFLVLRRAMELKFSREKLRYFAEKSREEALAASLGTDSEMEARLKELDRFLEAIVSANEPTVLKEEGSALLKVIAGTVFDDIDGSRVALLQPWEASNLGIGRGSLSPEERREIESHVSHTFEFLSNIPWTRELRQVPGIAYAHHEKLDGTGYPRGIAAAVIPVESKIMTISDIFDALTARDRPYKRAMPATKALDIIGMEVKEGKVDPHLFRIFVEGKVFELSNLPGVGGGA